MNFTETDRKWLAWLVVVALTVVGTLLGVNFPLPPTPEADIPIDAQGVEQGVTDLSGLKITGPTTVATATPVLLVDSDGVSQIVSFQDGATELFGVRNGGGAVVTGPTAVATAQPALVVDNAGVSNILEIRDAATPAARWEADGDLQLLLGKLTLSFTDLTVTDGYIITPTYSVYALDTAGAVTVTLAASANEGQLLTLINDDANATIIADTNIRTSDGNAVTMAGAYDITLWLYQDSEWLLLLSIANS